MGLLFLVKIPGFCSDQIGDMHWGGRSINNAIDQNVSLVDINRGVE